MGKGLVTGRVALAPRAWRWCSSVGLSCLLGTACATGEQGGGKQGAVDSGSGTATPTDEASSAAQATDSEPSSPPTGDEPTDATQVDDENPSSVDTDEQQPEPMASETLPDSSQPLPQSPPDPDEDVAPTSDSDSTLDSSADAGESSLDTTRPMPTLDSTSTMQDAGVPLPEEPLTGPEMYVALACNGCHGDEGEGISGLGPELRHPSAAHMTWLVRHGVDTPRLAAYGNGGAVQTMLAYGTDVLSDAQLDEIIAWLQAMPQPTGGAELFADYCGGCHGTDGRGGAMAVNGVVSAYATQYHSAPFSNKEDGLELDYVKAGHGTDVAERRGYMPGFAGVLTDSEINSILTWAHGQ